MNSLDELREKVLDTLDQMPDESLNPFEEAANYIVETLFSRHLEQEILKARIAELKPFLDRRITVIESHFQIARKRKMELEAQLSIDQNEGAIQ